MSTVILSPKYQVVIPLAVREALGLKPGQKVQVLRLGDCVELVPLRPMKRLRGSLKGIAPRSSARTPLSDDLALAAAMLGLEHKLPLADSVILATARACRATLWTQDADFDGLPMVRYRAKA